MTSHVFGKYNTRLGGDFRLYRNIQWVLTLYKILKLRLEILAYSPIKQLKINYTSVRLETRMGLHGQD